MMTSSNGNISALLALCEGDPMATGGFPSQRPVTRSFDVFSDLRLNQRLSKQSRHRWFDTPLRSLWRLYNVELISLYENVVFWHKHQRFICNNQINKEQVIFEIMACNSKSNVKELGSVYWLINVLLCLDFLIQRDHMRVSTWLNNILIS